MVATIDDALEILASTGPEYGDTGLANHGLMAAEALFALERPDAAIPWVEGYKSRLGAHPEAQDPITSGEWREALGDSRRVADWMVFFDRELAEASWEDVVGTWVPILAPALMAAATHGLIRTSHAVRSLSHSQTPYRIHELAEGLGYWAANYRLLPGRPSGRNQGFDPLTALERVERIHGSDFDASGSIDQQIRGLDDSPRFAGAIKLVDTSGDLSAFVSQLTETFAGLYLVNQRGVVAFVHTVTAPSLLRVLAPYLSDTDARAVARYAWQACAGIYAWYSAAPPPLASDEFPLPRDDRDALIDRAIAVGGPHTIKFTEACLREYDFNPKPVYLAAAWDATERVDY